MSEILPTWAVDKAGKIKPPILQVLAQDDRPLVYRPALNKITGHPLATLFLSQVVYWWHLQGRKPFYKFFRPAKNHSAYRPGDSWAEELGLTRYQIDGAIKNVSFRVETGASKKAALEKWLVLYWIDGFHFTFWELNEALFLKKLGEIYPESKICYVNPDAINQFWLEDISALPMLENSSGGSENQHRPEDKPALDRTENTNDEQQKKPNGVDSSKTWESILEVVQGQMMRGTFDQHLRGSQGVETPEGLRVVVGSASSREWLDNRLRSVIDRAAQSVAGRELRIEFLSPPPAGQ